MPLEDTPGIFTQAAQGLAWVLSQALQQPLPIAFGYMALILITVASVLLLVEFVKLYLYWALGILTFIFTVSLFAYVKLI